MSSPFNRLLNYWEQWPKHQSSQQRDERVTEELKAIPQTLDTSVIDEQQRRQPPTVPERPQRPPRQRRNQPPPATQQITPPLTPERDEFQENGGGRAPSPLFELDTTAPLTPNASVHSSSSLRETETRPHRTPSSPATNDNATIQQIQSELHNVQAQVQQLREERTQRAEEVHALQVRLHDLQEQYSRASQTAAQNAAALRTELDWVRAQERESRGRQLELEAELRTALGREGVLSEENERLLRVEARARRRRRGGGAGKEREREKGRHRHRQPQQGVGMGCFCM
jgi:hypothetical protein